MRRKKRFTIRLVALGFAVAAISAPVASAIPEGMDGEDLRALQSGGGQLVVGPDDRAIHGTNPQFVVSPDDRPSPRTVPVQPTQPVSAADEGGFELSNSVLGLFVLALLAVLMTGYAVYDVRKLGTPASA
jgi:hypothetical protein